MERRAPNVRYDTPIMANDEAALAAPTPALADRTPERRAAGLFPHLRYVARAVRPRQWTKNGIVFLALVFSVDQEYQLSDPDSWLPKVLASMVAFVCFVLVSSADYLVNDIRDIESDRMHPRKRKRPIAAGLLSVNAAWAWAAVLAVAGNAAAFALDWQMGLVVLAYTLLMIAYSYWLKHIVLIDLMVIAAGFVLRAMAGALAIDVPISAVAVRRDGARRALPRHQQAARGDRAACRMAPATIARSSTSTRPSCCEQMSSTVTAADTHGLRALHVHG